MNARLRGLTWDHPRGYAPLEELAGLDRTGDQSYGRVPGTVSWDRHPLEGFESTPLVELAGTYDLLVIDHPHLADAVESGALRPIDELVSADELDTWRRRSVGPSFDSYHHAMRQWAVPLDAATQVLAVRPDGPPPEATRTWTDILDLARRGSIALCLGGPHAFLTWTSLAIAHGGRPAGPEVYVDEEPALRAMEILTELHRHCDAALADRNPVQVLEALASGTGPDLCPLVYGYVTYSDTDDRGPAVAFRNAPLGPSGHIGSVLGGTGVAVSRHCSEPEVAAAHIRRLMSARVQDELISRVGGQPSSRSAWSDPGVNERWGGFYRDTRATVDAAWVRPRRVGWVEFQDASSGVLREGLTQRRPARAIVDAVNTLYRRHIGSLEGSR
ncbi:ABC transporter substrate-binding protein [Microtetraspora malaysiensis]|uniref:ABC transporter substrate-binding protein n=1 Tax=Microtetraspora malaysiensis TaxID=161358 RepID=UPI00082B5FD2|nr:extracellular solute-binding protein [Microtetraspora malaysiensis]